jgi:hypothetical protein
MQASRKNSGEDHSSLFGLLGGLALLANQGSARRLALIGAILSLSDLPFGTTLGIFTLIALLPLRGGIAPARP